MKLEDQSYNRRREIAKEIKLFEEEIIIKKAEYQPMDFDLTKLVNFLLFEILRLTFEIGRHVGHQSTRNREYDA